MDKILLSCAVSRFIAYCRDIYAKSVLAKVLRKIKALYMSSFLYRCFCAILAIPSAIPQSRFYKLFSKFNNFLSSFGDKIYPSLEKSVLYRGAKAFSNSKLIKGSSILRTCKSIGVRGFLLIALGLTLPIDWFIRDVAKIDALGSIWDEGLMILCICYILWRLTFTKGNPVKPRITPLDAPLLFFMSLGLLVMVMVSPDPSVSFAGYRAVCQSMLWFFVVTRLVEDDRDMRFFLYSLGAMAVVLALHGLYQYVVGAPMPSHWVTAAESTDMRTRIYSITGSPNILGALMVMCAPLFAALAYYVKPLWGKCLAWGATGLLCLAVIFTFSRGAWFGLAVAVVLFCLLVDFKLLAIAAVAVLGVILCVPAIGDRIGFLFTSDFAAANNKGGRGERWSIGMSLLRTNPVWGFGLGRFGGAIAMQNQSIEGLKYFYMDNYYMKTLVEMGYVGLSGYVFLLASNAWSSLRGLFRSKHTRLRILAAGLFSGMIGVLSHSFFENIFEEPYMNSYFWCISAVVMYICFLRKKEKQD